MAYSEKENMIKLSQLKPNPNNPRLIKDDKFKQLVKSIQDFPQMMELRPIIVDENNVIQGGNMRFKALLHLGVKEVPESYVKAGKDLTAEQWREFVIKDNISYGLNDWDMLANEWEIEDLINWGMDIPVDLDEIKATKDIPDIGGIEFSDELLLEHNYLVLYFDNLMDWEVAKEQFGLKTVKSKEAADNCKKIGIGRVVNGKQFLK